LLPGQFGAAAKTELVVVLILFAAFRTGDHVDLLERRQTVAR
jgi:hypothetical protein